MWGVVPGDLFSGDEMLPGIRLLSPVGSDMYLWLVGLKVYGVERIFIIFITVVVLFDITHNDGVWTVVHREESVHAILK